MKFSEVFTSKDNTQLDKKTLENMPKTNIIYQYSKGDFIHS